MNWGLGTVQFGTSYGISNKGGQTSAGEVSTILKLAGERGIEVVDTAPAYGDSEERLGQNLPLDHRFRLVTKSPLFKASVMTTTDADFLASTLRQSLKNLRQNHIEALLIHHGADLLKPGAELIVQQMKTLQSAGLVRKIGVSVYNSTEIDRILALFKPDIFQVPLNILDQRLLQSGHLSRLKQSGIEIHVRSIFLQGLLLLPPVAVDGYFDPIQNQLKSYHRFLDSKGLTSLQGALAFIRSLQALIDVALVGVCSSQELETILREGNETRLKTTDFEPFACSDENMVNPSLWKIATH